MPPRIFLLDCSPFGDSSLFAKGYRRIDDFRKKRVDRYAKEEDKRLGLGAGLLISYLRKKEGIKDEILYNEYGKAYFSNAKIKFNLSHSGDYAVLAVDEREIGVDVEKDRPHVEGIEAKVFTLKEQESLALLSKEERKAAFLRYWTEKESYLKYTGVGLSKPLTSVDFSSYAKKEDFAFLEADPALYFHHYAFEKGYGLCVCSTSKERPVLTKISLKEAVETSFLVNGERYELEDGFKGGEHGQCFLVSRKGVLSVLKCLHQDGEEGKKCREAKASYASLMGVGIAMPALYEVDEAKGRIRREYIPGKTLLEEKEEGKDLTEAKLAFKAYLAKLHEEKLRLNYRLENFLYKDGKLIYLESHCVEVENAEEVLPKEGELLWD
ncbi:MAG: 4'-phosphopantetheinyl transferase superfamily protein [Candidatus Enteromonas sp.]